MPNNRSIPPPPGTRLTLVTLGGAALTYSSAEQGVTTALRLELGQVGEERVRTRREGLLHQHHDAGAVHPDGFHAAQDEAGAVGPIPGLAPGVSLGPFQFTLSANCPADLAASPD